MPQFVTNTMRLCTKDGASSALFNPTVPVKPLLLVDGESDEKELCSDSPFDVPWSMEDAAQSENPAAAFSVGNVPMWDGSPLASNDKYPMDKYRSQLNNMDPGAWGFGVCVCGLFIPQCTNNDCTHTLCRPVVCIRLGGAWDSRGGFAILL